MSPKNKKKHTQSTGGSGMFGINKARTSIGMKVVLIFLALAMVLGTSAGVYALLTTPPKGSNNTNTNAKTQTSVDAQYQPQEQSIKGQIEKDPQNASLYEQLANNYFDWAGALMNLQSEEAGVKTAVSDRWKDAIAAYEKAIELNPKEDPEVKTDYSFALFYSEDTTKAIEAAKKVTVESPDFSMAYYSLGNSYSSLGESQKAIDAYKQYIKLDPTNSYGNVARANQAIKDLGGK